MGLRRTREGGRGSGGGFSVGSEVTTVRPVLLTRAGRCGPRGGRGQKARPPLSCKVSSWGLPDPPDPPGCGGERVRSSEALREPHTPRHLTWAYNPRRRHHRPFYRPGSQGPCGKRRIRQPHTTWAALCQVGPGTEVTVWVEAGGPFLTKPPF